ncbi:NrsF family protein [Lichenifustis flavocetrariae]|uniref:NrsF family protein n=1 Tax=Lichenifustis flavocetrariae TaxID=2949735 RepID=A0AA41Z1M7_9HYPH|nr:NrsF family protein [Lichenifustis flavocetrariae]MCW6512576.1 NrsF family protein [Lichenifustis flavocetrariae]
MESLVRDLGVDLRPVRRLRSPLFRAAGWLSAAAAAAITFACFADIADIVHRLRYVPDMWLAVLGSTTTTVFGAIAVFQLSLPDRRAAWALLPLPGLALWIGGTGLGCLRAWTIPGTEVATIVEARICFTFIVSLSIPLSALMILMIRRAYPMHPSLTAVTGGLTVAAGSATLLNFFHPYDAGATDIAVHVVAIALVVGANRLVAGWLLEPPVIRRSM